MLDHMAPWREAKLLAVDVEGDGNRPPGLVELAIVPISEGVIEQGRTWMFRPATPITWQATRVHGITNDDVRDLPRFAVRADEVRAALGSETVVVAHNAHVDLDVITRELPDWEPAGVIDTLKLSRKLHKDRSSHKLSVLADLYGLAGIAPEGLGPHRAGYDALMTARLLLRLIGDAGLETLGQLTVSAPVPATDALF